MKVDVLPDANAVANTAAAMIAKAARDAVAARGRFTLAVSGGRTPWQMLRVLAKEDVPWPDVHVFQVDERVAPAGDPERNFTHLRESLLEQAPLWPQHVYAMGVENADLAGAVKEYAETLRDIPGTDGVLDLVHLGLGPDGHTASLVPGDAVLDVRDADVALTSGTYQSKRRMTLTYPAINRARQILWVVTGADKVDALTKLRAADPSIPAGRINQERASVVADRAAAPG